MATKYFRVTGYYPVNDSCFIVDSYGRFNELWELGSFMVKKGMKVIHIGTENDYIDVNIGKIEEDKNQISLRAVGMGHPTYIDYEIDGVSYKAVKMEGKIYIPKN